MLISELYTPLFELAALPHWENMKFDSIDTQFEY